MTFQKLLFCLTLSLYPCLATPFLIDSQDHDTSRYSTSSDQENDLFENSQVSPLKQTSKESSDDDVELFEKSQVTELEEQSDPLESCDCSQQSGLFPHSQELFPSSLVESQDILDTSTPLKQRTRDTSIDFETCSQKRFYKPIKNFSAKKRKRSYQLSCQELSPIISKDKILTQVPLTQMTPVKELSFSPSPKRKKYDSDWFDREISPDILEDEILSQELFTQITPVKDKSFDLSSKKRKCCSSLFDRETSPDILADKLLTQAPSTPSTPQDILTPPLIESMVNLKDDYDVFLIDIVGVVHDGKNPFQDAIQAINTLARENKKVALVSNTPRPHKLSLKTLSGMGLNPNIPIFTAGDQVRQVLEQDYKGQKIYHFGAECNQDILQGIDVISTPTLDHAKVVLLTQYVDDSQSLKKYDHLIKDIAEKQLLVLCANADKTASVGNKLRYCAGTLAAKIEDLKGIVQYYGKPSCALFEHIMQEMPTIQKDRILIIGDTLEKDIKWGSTNEVDSVLILTGTTGQEIEKIGKNPIETLKKLCKDQKTRPTYRMNKMQ